MTDRWGCRTCKLTFPSLFEAEHHIWNVHLYDLQQQEQKISA
jgi:hypothetical protein